MVLESNGYGLRELPAEGLSIAVQGVHGVITATPSHFHPTTDAMSTPFLDPTDAMCAPTTDAMSASSGIHDAT
jgi:hypothetical protein